MSDLYGAIAPYYDSLGMSEFATRIAPQIVHFAHGLDWIGRRVVDFGCGTGASTAWFASQGFNVVGVDRSPAMLEVARASIDSAGLALEWQLGGIEALDSLREIDLVVALDVANELNSVRDLEQLFRSVAQSLSAGKLFIFDLHTLEGLAADDDATHLIRDDDQLTAFVVTQFDHERQTRLDDLRVFVAAGQGWQRLRMVESRHGFPVQVVSALLGRAGFHVAALVDEAFAPVTPAHPRAARAIYFSQRSSS
ncbi:MAG: class I SAM-dependent methyltransferase [Chloroflexi bacterium]|nr:class I SAM-dependent methyltransferase [Chloroflexota bacterium]